MSVIEDAKIGAVDLAADLTMAWLSNPNTRASADDVPAFLKTMHDAVSGLTSSSAEDTPKAAAEPGFTRAVSVRKSLGSKDHIISMIDGKSYRTLRRHLSTNGLTPKDYIERYNLPKDYPMVAPSYSEARRAMAKKIGLGRKSGEKAPTKAAATSPAPKASAKRTRKAPA
jgi:predicted transcriptional regulator